MSTSPRLDDISGAQCDPLRALARREVLADIAGRTGRPADEILEQARQGMVALAGETDAPGAAERASIGDYLLGRQSPGQAEGTWRLLDGSPAATRWAERLRDALAEAGLEDPPPLPTDDGALSPTQRAHRERARRRGTASRLGERREQRGRRRTAAAAQQAAAEFASPFRSEAVAAHEAADDRIELPRWAPRPVQLTLYAVMVVLAAGLAFCIFVRIPVNTNGVVLVTDLPPGSPGAERPGIQLIALFPSASGRSQDTGSGADVEVGDVLRVALPGEQNRTPVKLRWVSGRQLAPRQVVDSYRLPLGQANRVVSPSHVALAPLRPPGRKPARAYEGTTTLEASVQTGSRRIISLLF